MANIVMNGSLYKMTKDREGCIRLILEIPKKDAPAALEIPEETELRIEIEPISSI